jgi:hypothetical protein
MNGYRARLKRSQAHGRNGAQALPQVFFPSSERALEEGKRCFTDIAGSPDLDVEEVEDLLPHYVGWCDEHPVFQEHEEIMLLPANVIASSQVEQHLRRIAREFTLRCVRPATDEEVKRLAA